MSKPNPSSRLRFWKPCSGNSGDYHVWNLATDFLLHIPPTDPLRRIYRPADSRGKTLESPAGRSFDPSAEGAMTTACPPLSLIICLCLSLLSTDYCLSPCCHILRRCSLMVRTLCLRREKWDHYPPAVWTKKSYFVLLILCLPSDNVQYVSIPFFF